MLGYFIEIVWLAMLTLWLVYLTQAVENINETIALIQNQKGGEDKNG